MSKTPRSDYNALIFPRQMDSRRSQLPDGTSIALRFRSASGTLLVRRHRQRVAHGAKDVLPPGVELLDGETVLAVDLVMQFFAAVFDFDADRQAPVLGVTERHLDRSACRKLVRQVGHDALAQLRTIVGRGALAFNDPHQDRALIRLLCLEDALGGDGEWRVSRYENRIPRATRLAVNGHDAQTVRIHVLDLERRAAPFRLGH